MFGLRACVYICVSGFSYCHLSSAAASISAPRLLAVCTLAPGRAPARRPVYSHGKCFTYHLLAERLGNYTMPRHLSRVMGRAAACIADPHLDHACPVQNLVKGGRSESVYQLLGLV